MKRIALIDDDPEYRSSVATMIGYAINDKNLQDEWEVIAAEPLQDQSTYGQWVNTNEITTILIDQRLDEVASESGQRADYHGSSAVEIIRQTHKDVPIYVITSHSPAPPLEANLGLFEDIIEKSAFSRAIPEFLTRIIRSSERFLSREGEKLARLSELSEKIALSTASDSEKSEAAGIQQDLYIPFTTNMLARRTEWTEQYNNSIAELEALKGDVDEYLSNHKDKK